MRSPGWLKTWLGILWRSVLFVLAWAALYAPIVIIAGRAFSSDGAEFSWAQRLFFDATGLVSILASTWLLLRFLERRSLVSLGFEGRKFIPHTALGLAIGSIMVAISMAILWSGRWLAIVDTPAFNTEIVGVAGMSILLNAALQEVLCRSYIFQAIRRRASVTAAVAVTSVIFVLLHAAAIGDSFLAAVNLLAAGILLGIAYQLSGNLWLPISLHFAWNMLLGPVLGLSVSGQALDIGHKLVEVTGPEWLTGGDFGVEASLAATAATLIATVLIYVIFCTAVWRRRDQR